MIASSTIWMRTSETIFGGLCLPFIRGVMCCTCFSWRQLVSWRQLPVLLSRWAWYRLLAAFDFVLLVRKWKVTLAEVAGRLLLCMGKHNTYCWREESLSRKLMRRKTTFLKKTPVLWITLKKSCHEMLSYRPDLHSVSKVELYLLLRIFEKKKSQLVFGWVGTKNNSTSLYIGFFTSRSYIKSIPLVSFHRRSNWGTAQETNLFQVTQRSEALPEIEPRSSGA